MVGQKLRGAPAAASIHRRISPNATSLSGRVVFASVAAVERRTRSGNAQQPKHTRDVRIDTRSGSSSDGQADRIHGLLVGGTVVKTQIQRRRVGGSEGWAHAALRVALFSPPYPRTVRVFWADQGDNDGRACPPGFIRIRRRGPPEQRLTVHELMQLQCTLVVESKQQVSFSLGERTLDADADVWASDSASCQCRQSCQCCQCRQCRHERGGPGDSSEFAKTKIRLRLAKIRRYSLLA